MNNNKKLIGTSVLAAITASLCCITPVLALLAGTSGIASTFSFIEPFRPYLIGFTILVLTLAWYQQLRSNTREELECGCDKDEKTSFWQSKKFLGIVTLFSTIMLAFPYFSSVFYPNHESNNTFAMSTDIKEITVDVKGMTCASCEQHIEHTVAQLEGVNSVNASYTSGTTTIHFASSLINDKTIIDAINKTGYEVLGQKGDTQTIYNVDETISFYSVPLVCNAAPTIGCGSRAKPVLLDLQNAPGTKGAWLNRSGTTIAVVWEEGLDLTFKHNVATGIFKKHRMGAKELTADDYVKALSSFGQKENWLKGSEVDRLSAEEASTIADQIIKSVRGKTTLSFEQEKKLHQKITDTFYEFFLNFEDLTDLGDPEVYKTKLKDIWRYGENLIGNGKMPSLEELWSSCSNAAKSCNHESCSSSCKTPKS